MARGKFAIGLGKPEPAKTLNDPIKLDHRVKDRPSAPKWLLKVLEFHEDVEQGTYQTLRAICVQFHICR